MPKITGKRNVRKKRRQSGNSNNNNNEPRPKRSKVSAIKTKNDDSIAVSRQLSIKIQSNGSTRKPSTSYSTKNNESKMCGNGKPMPSLAELEKMYTDSEDETCKSPEKPVAIPISPKSISNIATRLMDRITTISNPTELSEVLPPAPIVPQKKRKKSDKPYIDGCKERPQVIKTSNTNFCKGGDYSVHLNADSSEDEDSLPKQRQKRSKKANISKSIFNAQSDDIAKRLIENEDSNESTDSNKTIIYHNVSNIDPSRPPSFSPIPSTSRDNETILKNEQLFNESMCCENNNNESQSDVEVIPISGETIVIDDDSVNFIDSSDKDGCDLVLINGDNEDSAKIIVSDEVEKTNRNNNISPIDADEYYSSIVIDEDFDNHDVEEIKIDDLIRENNAIICKFDKESDLNVITQVVPGVENPNKPTSNNEPINVSAMIPETSNNTNIQPTQVSSESLKEPSVTDNTLSKDHNKPNTKNKKYATDKIKNMLSNIVTNFFNNVVELDNSSEASSSNINETVDLTQEMPLPSKEKEKNEYLRFQLDPAVGLRVLSFLASSIQYHQDGMIPTKSMKSNANKSQQIPETPLTSAKYTPKYSSPIGHCPICMDSLGKNIVASTMCGHVFCLKCIQAAIKANGKKCPTCRKYLKGAGYHQLFL